MPDLIEQTEGVPSIYPAPPGDLSDAASQLDSPAIWKRLEDWISYRWAERSVEWIVRGPGIFAPPLLPATIDNAEVEKDGTTQTVELTQTLPGYELDARVYRITATVGSTDDPPPTIMEAYRRLAEYLVDADPAMPIAATAFTQTIGDATNVTDRPTAWKAKALHHSGAADLLRGYR